MDTILILGEHRRGELRPVTLELIGAAQTVRSGGTRVVVALVGRKVEALAGSLARAGVDEVVSVITPVDDFDPDISETAARALIERFAPSLILLPHSVDSYGFAAVLAARTGMGFATDVFRLALEHDAVLATRGGYGQKVAVEVDFPGRAVVMLAVRAGVFKAAEEPGAPLQTVLDLTALVPGTTALQYIEQSAGDDVDISAVDFILSVGRGVGDEANLPRFRALADKLGATLCCSRPIADSGWLPKSRQVGQSGKTAAGCKLYVAMGISGAIQHLAGMKHVETIVAINTDPQASIFSVAKYGIVGDLFEVADALEEHFG
jgi:electron transfer flavoprotein alpha subunit